MATNYEIGEAAGIEKGVAACRVLIAKLAAARRDSAEWKEQHENLLAMFRAAEQRAVKAEAALRMLSETAFALTKGELEALIDYHDHNDAGADAMGYIEAAAYHSKRSKEFQAMREKLNG